MSPKAPGSIYPRITTNSVKAQVLGDNGSDTSVAFSILKV